MKDDTKRPLESAERHIASLLGQIEKEPAPERLLSLARQLQAALASRNGLSPPDGDDGAS